MSTPAYNKEYISHKGPQSPQKREVCSHICYYN